MKAIVADERPDIAWRERHALQDKLIASHEPLDARIDGRLGDLWSGGAGRVTCATRTAEEASPSNGTRPLSRK